jgi:hypothetical protein
MSAKHCFKYEETVAMSEVPYKLTTKKDSWGDTVYAIIRKSDNEIIDMMSSADGFKVGMYMRQQLARLNSNHVLDMIL